MLRFALSSDFQKTADPLSLGPAEQNRPQTTVASIEVLFHSDLRRVGERCVLGPVNEPTTAYPVLLGRDMPLFRPLHGGAAQGLLDPCISRRQATIFWQPEQGTFRVEAQADARRPLRLLTLDGRPLPMPVAEPGSLLAVGDRLLLLLSVRPSGAEQDALGMIGQSGAMAALRQRILAVAHFDDTVLIQGETGTGKELVAEAIHLASERRSRPFVALNCAALPETLIESELFGHTRGAFSGASQSKPGVFAAAVGGTLFLDEVGEMPLSIQAKLLRVLEVRRVRPVGAQQEEPVDVRVVVATLRNLAELVAQGKFREDLYGRIESPQLRAPPLRERREDIPALFLFFLNRRAQEYARQQGRPWGQTPFAQFWREATLYPPPISLDHFLSMLGHGWPRNVREVDKFAAEVATSIVQGHGMPPPWGRTYQPVPHRSNPTSPPAQPPPEAEHRQHQRPERPELERVLEEQNFNQADAARALGVSYATLDRWMRDLGVARPKDISREELAAAWQQARGDTGEMARLLHVSLRGLKARLKELGIEG